MCSFTVLLKVCEHREASHQIPITSHLNIHRQVSQVHKALFSQLWDKGHTRITVDILETCLKDYTNKQDAELLLRSFKEGLRRLLPSIHRTTFFKFLSKSMSVERHREVTKAKLLKEVQLGRMLGPFTKKPISTLRVSPVGLVPRHDGGWGLITQMGLV